MSLLCTYWVTYFSSYIIYRNLARPPWGREGLLFPSFLYPYVPLSSQHTREEISTYYPINKPGKQYGVSRPDLLIPGTDWQSLD